MTTQTDRAETPDQRRERVELLLTRYPDLSDAEIADLLHWFRKEASALDVAMLASDESLARAYQPFRAAHLDRLSAVEIAVAVLIVALIIAGLAAFALLT